MIGVRCDLYGCQTFLEIDSDRPGPPEDWATIVTKDNKQLHLCPDHFFEWKWK